MQLLQEKAENRQDFEAKVGLAIAQNGVQVDDSTIKHQKAAEWLVDRGKSINDNYVDGVRCDLAIKEQKALLARSIIDDYADVSLEQPSYMDPED